TAPTPPRTSSVELRWQSATVPNAITPATNLYPRAEFEAFAKTFTRLHKAALIINNFKLTASEVAYVSAHSLDFGSPDLNLLPLSDRESAVQGDAVDVSGPNPTANKMLHAG